MSDFESKDTANEGEVPHETMEEFKKRVRERTGVDFDDIPKGEEADAVLHIICRKGNIYVVGADENAASDDEGNLVFTKFKVIELKQ